MDSQKPSFEKVYKSELTKLTNIATFFLSSRALAEEAVHDAFIKLHKNWDTVRNPAPFVKRTTINRCKDLLKSQKRYSNRLRLLHSKEDELHERHYLFDVLEKIDDRRRLILVLRFYGDYQLNEIAEILEIPEGTVRSNLYRGLEQLKELLPDEFQ